MKKRLLTLLVGFIMFYFLVHAAYDLPNVVHGNLRLSWMPANSHPLLFLMIDMAASALFAVVPYLVLYRFYTNGARVLAFVLIVPATVLLFFLYYCVQKYAIDPRWMRLRMFFNNNLFFFSVYLVYAVVFYFIRLAYFKEAQQRELVIQNRQSELSFLRSQVNPHFLFNSLNNIYALVYDASPQALPAIAGFSELLRYMLYDNKDIVPLTRELDYIQRYIDLQRLRFEHTIKADVQVSGKIDNVQVPPLMLIPFVENAFKHGDFSAGGDGVTVVVRCTEQTLHFYCRNTKGKGQKDAGGGIGLTNIKRRLQLLYPGRHTLDIEEDNNCFTINMDLQYA